HLQHDVCGFNRFMPAWCNACRQKELVVNVEAVCGDRIGDEHFLGQVPWFYKLDCSQWVVAGDDQNLFVIEDGLKMQPGFEQRVWSDQQVNFVTEQGTNSTELEFLFDV